MWRCLRFKMFVSAYSLPRTMVLQQKNKMYNLSERACFIRSTLSTKANDKRTKTKGIDLSIVAVTESQNKPRIQLINQVLSCFEGIKYFQNEI